MHDNESRHAASRKKIKPRVHPLFCAAALIAAAYFCVGIARLQASIEQAQVERAQVESEIVKAREESVKLADELAMQGDAAYVERIARERLGMIKPGERVFVDTNRQ